MCYHGLRKRLFSSCREANFQPPSTLPDCAFHWHGIIPEAFFMSRLLLLLLTSCEALEYQKKKFYVYNVTFYRWTHLEGSLVWSRANLGSTPVLGWLWRCCRKYKALPYKPIAFPSILRWFCLTYEEEEGWCSSEGRAADLFSFWFLPY